jgi:hypothetical protein
VRIPNDKQRLTLYGQTGSGKTVAGLWHLAHRSYDTRPWLVLDFKGDEHIAEIPFTDELEPGKVPKKPGLYVMRPVPATGDDEKLEQTLWGVWRQEKTGVYVDEGYMIPRRSEAFNALLTQGRSKQTPLITLSQRPVWMSRFVISESDFHQVFFLADAGDRDSVQRFIPHEMRAEHLPRHHSYYYDVGERDFRGLKPVPQPSETMNLFEHRLDNRLRVYSI